MYLSKPYIYLLSLSPSLSLFSPSNYNHISFSHRVLGNYTTARRLTESMSFV
ncbi:hypothetical protein YC2023_074793 [Brassica napus]